jgi:hypothetical protein
MQTFVRDKMHTHKNVCQKRVFRKSFEKIINFGHNLPHFEISVKLRFFTYLKGEAFQPY